MKKITLLFLLTLFSNFGFSQNVGINNNNPQQALHVSGSGTTNAQPIIRIDGLNSTNNSAHASTTSIKKVFADTNGDLVIAADLQTKKYYTSATIPTTNILPNSEQLVQSLSFTLDYPSLVHFEGKIGIAIGTLGASNTIQDSQARLFGTYFKFTAAPSGVNTNTAFARRVSSFASLSNSPSTLGVAYIGSYYLDPKKDLFLPAGNYTVGLYGYSQATDQNITFNGTGLQANQQFRVSITPVSY